MNDFGKICKTLKEGDISKIALNIILWIIKLQKIQLQFFPVEIYVFKGKPFSFKNF